MPLIDHDELYSCKALLRVRICEKERETFRCSDEYGWQRLFLPRSRTCRSIAGSRFDCPWQTDSFDRFTNCFRNIIRQSPKRRDPEDRQWWMDLTFVFRLQPLEYRPHKYRIRFAGTSRCVDES